MESIDNILKERGERYGDFTTQSVISQELKTIVVKGYGWRRFRPYQAEGMSMILHKISRIVNGDPDYVDSWRDVEGYAKRVADELERQQTRPS